MRCFQGSVVVSVRVVFFESLNPKPPDSLWEKKKAPTVGLEPTTTRLRVLRSTN